MGCRAQHKYLKLERDSFKKPPQISNQNLLTLLVGRIGQTFDPPNPQMETNSEFIL